MANSQYAFDPNNWFWPEPPVLTTVSKDQGDTGPPVSAQVHYTGLSPEPIDVIESWNLNFRIGNALKYIARAGRKDDAVRDYRKAISYIQREINALSTGKPAW